MAKPLLRMQYITEEGCEYPVAVRVAMDDGHVLTYCLENKLDLKFEKLKKDIQKSVEIGYQYKPPKKRRCRAYRSQL